MTDDQAALADLLPLGYGPRDPHDDTHAAAAAILASDWMRDYLARHVEAFREQAVVALDDLALALVAGGTEGEALTAAVLDRAARIVRHL